MSQLEWETEPPKLKEYIYKNLHTGMGIHQDGYQFSRAYKSRVWDGIVDFFNNKDNTFPTGLLDQVESVLGSVQESVPSFSWSVADHRDTPLLNADLITEPIQLLNGTDDPITLFDYQQKAVQAAIHDQVSMLNLATNAGKTECAAGIIHMLLPYIKSTDKVSFACFSKEIFHQSAERLEKRLGIKIGKFGDGKKDIRQVNVVMIPTLNRALEDPAKKVKLTSEKDRLVKKMATEYAPLFINKENTAHLLANWLKGFCPKTHIEQSVKEIFVQAVSQKLSNKQLDKAMQKYVQMYDKLIEKKAGKEYKRYNDAKKFIEQTKVLICDEAHHAKSPSYYDVLMNFSSPYRIALSGTLDESDKMGWQRLQAIFSHKSVIVHNKELIEKGISAKPTVYMITVTEPRVVKRQSDTVVSFENMKDWQSVYKIGIVDNSIRNQLIVQTTKSLYSAGETIMLTVAQTSQGDNIAELFKKENLPYEYMYGDLDSITRANILNNVRSGVTRILIITTLGDEGLDLPEIGSLIYCGGGKTSRGVLQRIGRVLRKKKTGTNTAMVFDFVDRTNWYLYDHSKQRLKIYEEEGFEVKYLNGGNTNNE